MATGDNISIVGRIDTDLDPDATGTYDLGSSTLKWKDAHFSGTVTAPTLAGNINIGSGTSNFNNVSISGTLTATTLSGNATSADVLSTARDIGGVSFDGSANINLPGVNTAGNQDTSGNAGSATQVYVTETTTAQNYPIVFTDSLIAANSGNMGLQKDDGSLFFNPSANTLTVSTIACADITSTNGFGTATQNAYGARTVSNGGNPSGGSDGDIWYKY